RTVKASSLSILGSPCGSCPASVFDNLERSLHERLRTPLSRRLRPRPARIYERGDQPRRADLPARLPRCRHALLDATPRGLRLFPGLSLSKSQKIVRMPEGALLEKRPEVRV